MTLHPSGVLLGVMQISASLHFNMNMYVANQHNSEEIWNHQFMDNIEFLSHHHTCPLTSHNYDKDQ